MNEKEFATYVEHVFRHHNQVLNDLITSEHVQPASPETDEDDIQDTETEMIRTCDPLNEVVIAETEHRKVGLSTMMKLADVVPECEAITRELEALILPRPAPPLGGSLDSGLTGGTAR